MKLVQPNLVASLSILSAILVALPAQANTFTFEPSAPWMAQAPLPAGEGWIPVNPASQPAPVQPLPPVPRAIQVDPLNPQSQQPPFSLQTTLLLRSGDMVVVSYGSPERLLIAPGETRPMSMVLDTPMRDAQGNMVVPAGSILEGQFQPVSGGTQFVSRAITVNGQSYPLYAQSNVIANQRDPRQTSGEAIVQDALIGAAAGAILSGIFGSRVISTERVLGGAAAGAVIGNVTAPEVAIIDPGRPLNLTVLQDFQPAVR